LRESLGKARIKEAETIKIPPLPSATQFRSWKVSVRTEVTAASGRGDVAFKWILLAESPSSSFESLATSGTGFESLDAKLAAAMTKLSHGELGRLFSLATEHERLADPPRMIKGRQLLWTVHDYHKFDEEVGAIMDIKDLMSIKLRGDAGLETFMNSWDMVVAGMQEVPVESILEPLFLEQVRAAPALREEVAHYDRSRKGMPDRTYAYLLESVRRYLERQRLQRNRAAVAKQLGNPPGSPAFPSTTDHKKKKSGKGGKKGGKSRSPSRSRSPDGNKKKGVCYDYQRTGSCARERDCPYEHVRGKSDRSSSNGKGGRARSPPPGGKGKGKGKDRKNVPCRFFANGSCKLGDKCAYSHRPVADAAPASRGRSSSPKRGKKKDGEGSAAACVIDHAPAIA